MSGKAYVIPANMAASADVKLNWDSTNLGPNTEIQATRKNSDAVAK